MKKYRVIGNTSFHKFHKGQIIRMCSEKETNDLSSSYGKTKDGNWMTSDGSSRNSWVVKPCDIKKVTESRIVSFLKSLFKAASK